VSAGPRRGLTREELAEATAHGHIYLRRLRRAQLALSLSSLVAFGGLVGALPLVMFLLPSLRGIEVLGLRLPIVLVLLPFPLFLAIGWLHQRRADGLDAAFRDLVGEEES
jgi:hypothetical protein